MDVQLFFSFFFFYKYFPSFRGSKVTGLLADRFHGLMSPVLLLLLWQIKQIKDLELILGFELVYDNFHLNSKYEV